jgi:hypothetical protein
MPICYFNQEFEKKYNCEYEINDDYIEVVVDYNIGDEIEPVNGVRAFGIDTEYKDRDILIVDYKGKNNILLKNAYWVGNNNVYGTPDGGSKTRFNASIYFLHRDFTELAELPVTPKINRIKVYSKELCELYGYPSLKKYEDKDEYTISLAKNGEKEKLYIGHNNIRELTISDTWNTLFKKNKHCISIDLNCYIEISLNRRINYKDVFQFIYELSIYMQLYRPNKFVIDKLYVMIDDKYYRFNFYNLDIKYSEKYIKNSVECSLMEFLERCYSKIPYRNSKTEIRNIPYIIFNDNRGLEDDFLMFYRFIECYYKKQQIPYIKKRFIMHSIREHYLKDKYMSEEEIENYSQEIVSLRNQYVHAGYYLKNASLRVKFEKVNNKRNPKNYTVNNVDAKWIYERTKILYNIVIDIVFTKMLEYDEYKYEKEYF